MVRVSHVGLGPQPATMLEQLLLRVVTDETPAEVRVAVAALTQAIQDVTDTPRPLLSVIMRTQGTRLEALADALSSLAEQSSQDFEVLLIVHSGDTDARGRVENVIAGQPESIREKIALMMLQGGGRSAPLNFAIPSASGRYLAVFDDDDLLLPGWVASFARSEIAAGGRLMRARVGTQNVTVTPADGDQPAVVLASSIRDDYPARFDSLRQFELNASPFMGWAFPRALFTRLGVRFNEDLQLLEDWDVVLRGGTLLGVHQIDELTAVYRRWSTGDSSMATSPSEAWSVAEMQLIRALNSAPVLLDVGAVQRLRKLLAKSDELDSMRSSRSWRLALAIRRVVNTVRRILPKGVEGGK